VTFAAGQNTATVNIAIIDDTLVEYNESMRLLLTGGTNVVVGNGSAYGTIISDDPTSTPPPPPPPPPAPTVVANDVTANEADGALIFTLTRSGDLSAASSVNFATGNGTATAGSDYVANSGTASFAAGQATTTVRVTLLNDSLVEANEAFNLLLSGGTNITIADGTGVGTIVSDDVAAPPPAPAPTVAVNDVTANEANGTLVFTLTRSGDLSASSSVSYATADGTATAGSDYTAVTGTATFAAGQATTTVSVALLNDVLVENNETFSLLLSGGSNISVADGTGLGTIVSDDVVPPPPSAPPGTINGTEAADNLIGGGANESLFGLGGDDILNGKGGADRLTGGAGSDRFIFDSVANAKDDVIADFQVGQDKIDLRSIDADSVRKGSQKFTWIDTDAFSGKAGQLREYVAADGHHFIAGDTNGDGVADFTIEVAGTNNLSSGDFFF
jgi:Ca2+-binding RTX toxin-like protein